MSASRNNIVNKLIYIGGSSFEQKQESFFSKTSVVRHVEGLAKYFDQTIWIANVEKTENFKTKIAINTKGFKHNFRSIFEICKYLLTQDRKTYYYFHTENPYFRIVALIIFFLKKGKVFIYFGNNFYVNFNSLNAKATIRSWIQWLNAIFSHGNIVRGKLFTKKIKRLNKNTIETIPIMNRPTDNAKNKKVNGNTINLLFIGKLVTKKGIFDLLKAFNLIMTHNKQKEYFLNIVGYGEKKDKIINYASKNNFLNKIKLWGYIDNEALMSKIYSQNDILILPSHESYGEGIPRVISEAIAHQLLVLSSDLPGFKEEFMDKGIIYFQPKDYQKLADLIMRYPFSLELKQSGYSSVNCVNSYDQHARFILNK